MIRRPSLLSILLVAATALPAGAQVPGAATTKFRVYVGTYTNAKSKGIYLLDLDTTSGALTPKGIAAETPSPSFLALHPSGKFLYAANEVNTFDGKPEGGVTAFAIDGKEGTLREVNHQASGGTGPCYVSTDPMPKVLMVANYGSGTIAAFPIGPDGKLGEASTKIAHHGSGPNKGRQSGPHAHSIDLDPSLKFALVNDLGLDRTLVYRLDADKATLTPNAVPFAASKPGAGPRHLAFNPVRPTVYVINELDSTITVNDFDAKAGTLAPVQTISTLPPEGKRGSSTAEIAVHPSGRFVYGSNRGADTLAIYEVEPASGKLTLIGFQSTGGKTPRNFAIDPTGTLLLAANQGSDTVVVFRIDRQTGKLAQVGEPVAVPIPVCILFAPLGG